MIEKNIKIYKIWEGDVTVKNVYNRFFEIDSRILYVVDTADKLSGIITSRDFMRCLKNGENRVPVKNRFSVITQKEEQNVLEEAAVLVEKYHITTAIPVIDEEGRICYEIRIKKNTEWNSLVEFHEKVRKYETSHYLGQELVYLQKLLSNQDVTVIGTEEQFEQCLGNLFEHRKKVTFRETLSDAYEFMYHNTELLIDVSLTEYSGRQDIYLIGENGYSWNECISIVVRMIELEYCSRLYRVTGKNSIVTIKDYLEKYSKGSVWVSKIGIFTSVMKAHLRENHFNMIEEKGICRREAFAYQYKGNGITFNGYGGDNELYIMENTDVMLQYVSLNERFGDIIPVLNYAFDVSVQIPDIKEKTITLNQFCDFGNYISNAKTREKLYRGEAKELEALEELMASLRFQMTRRLENDLIVLSDYSSNFVNIENGMRKTCCQPEMHWGTIYCFGMCTIYGAMVEDRYTIPSLIQNYVNRSGKKYRVVNLGNELLSDVFRLEKILNIQENDIIVTLFPFVTEKIKECIPVIEIGGAFNRLWEQKFYDKESFMDIVQHCGDYGNLIYAEVIFRELQKYLVDADEKALRKNNIYDVFKRNEMDLNALYGWEAYFTKLRYEKKKIPENAERIGCIVMNCNPFTLGHRYLVEYALQSMDYLFIFVVEEERSFFPFKDRYEMVQKGIQDLNNVSVIESGKLIISFETFPNYFQKENQKKSGNTAGRDVSTREELRVFAQYVAPVLGIEYRFVGEEPMDNVTNQYNKMMKEVLPEAAGIHVVEIPRKCMNGEIISASAVRTYYQENDFQSMSTLVPETTLKYLLEGE